MKFFKPVVQHIDRPFLLQAFLGGLLGAIISVLVNAVMLEISDNEFFAFYFGILFLIIGTAVIKRVTLSPTWNEGGRISRGMLGGFAFIITLASLSCFILDKNKLKLTPHQRIPFYITLGIAVSFAVTFAVLDTINLITNSFVSPKQVVLILGSSVLTGFLFGLIFGILDVEDDPSIRHALIKDERFAGPVGAIFGSLTAIASRFMVQNDPRHHPYHHPIPDSPEDNL